MNNLDNTISNQSVSKFNTSMYTQIPIDTEIQVLSNPFVVYQKGDIVKQPMKSRDVLPKNIPGVGWGGWVMWGGSCRGGGGVCHAGVGWVMENSNLRIFGKSLTFQLK